MSTTFLLACCLSIPTVLRCYHIKYSHSGTSEINELPLPKTKDYSFACNILLQGKSIHHALNSLLKLFLLFTQSASALAAMDISPFSQ